MQDACSLIDQRAAFGVGVGVGGKVLHVCVELFWWSLFSAFQLWVDRRMDWTQELYTRSRRSWPPRDRTSIWQQSSVAKLRWAWRTSRKVEEMKGVQAAVTTLSVVKGESASGEHVLIEVKDAPSGMKTDAAYDEDLADTVERLHAELRRKEGELRRKDEELLAARDQFSELELCSREVEQELEGEISRLNRLNNELENENRSLVRRLENELQRVKTQPSTRNDEVAQLRQQLQRLEQENDDLQTSVRRLEATREDLGNALEHAEEQLVFAQQEFDDFKCEADEASKQLHDEIRDLKANLKKYQALVSSILQTGIPYAAWSFRRLRAATQTTPMKKAMKAATTISRRVAAPSFVKRNE